MFRWLIVAASVACAVVSLWRAKSLEQAAYVRGLHDSGEQCAARCLAGWAEANATLVSVGLSPRNPKR